MEMAFRTENECVRSESTQRPERSQTGRWARTPRLKSPSVATHVSRKGCAEALPGCAVLWYPLGVFLAVLAAVRCLWRHSPARWKATA